MSMYNLLEYSKNYRKTIGSKLLLFHQDNKSIKLKTEASTK